MNPFQQLKANQEKVSNLKEVSIPILGFESETEDSIVFIIETRRGDYKNVLISKKEFTHGDNDTIIVSGKLAADKLFYAVDKKYFK